MAQRVSPAPSSRRLREIVSIHRTLPIAALRQQNLDARGIMTGRNPVCPTPGCGEPWWFIPAPASRRRCWSRMTIRRRGCARQRRVADGLAQRLPRRHRQEDRPQARRSRGHPRSDPRSRRCLREGWRRRRRGLRARARRAARQSVGTRRARSAGADHGSEEGDRAPALLQGHGRRDREPAGRPAHAGKAQGLGGAARARGKARRRQCAVLQGHAFRSTRNMWRCAGCGSGGLRPISTRPG